jgi:simple sugar transport system substrate-binding protein
MTRKSIALVSVFVLLFMAIAPIAAQDEVVFGVVLVGPRNDRGWSQSHFEGGQYVEANYEGGATMLYFESLNPADTPEATLLDVVTEMVDNGASVIFTTSDSFEEDTNVVAQAFPDVTFVNITGSNAISTNPIVEASALDLAIPEPAPVNVSNFNGYMEIPRMLAGCSAALTTETGKIGYLGALINPETRRLVVSTYLGAQYCYENYRGMDPAELEMEVVWIGFWFNIPGVTLDPTEVATEFVNGGADVIVSGIDTTEAISVAGQFNADGTPIYAIPYGNINGCAEAPDACLGAAFYNWGPAYLNVINQVQAGTWEQNWDFIPPVWDEISDEGFYMGADTSVIGYVLGDGFAEENVPTLQEFADEIAAYMTDEANEGTLFLWEGPLALQDGTPLADEGEPVALLDIWFLPQLTEGIIGASE